MKRSLAIIFSVSLGVALLSAAHAQDAAIVGAQAAGTVGEGADGYLGVRGSVSADVRARVDQVNIKRRAVYTDLAAKRGVTIAEVAGAAACQILDSVGTGHWYRDAGGGWRQHTAAAPVAKPGFCG